MKFIVALLLTAVLAFIGGLYFPWWSIAVAAFVIGLLVRQKAWLAWLAGFLGLFLLWVLLAWLKNAPNDGLLSGKIGELLGIGNNPVLLIIITGFLGGIVAGFAALTGSMLIKGSSRAQR
jgi:hypothetical protein